MSLSKVPNRKPRVLVAMSGGVDSSVAAALLVEQGYDVIGVTMQVWDYTNCDIQDGAGTCCSSVDVDDARAVADRLGFPFYVINCEAKFQAYVIDPFIGSYLEGKTPLPCVNCNTYLKFDHLVQKMHELECDFIATGHYAQVKYRDMPDDSPGDRATAAVVAGTAQAQIVTSTDDWKDQTYFLFTMDPKLIPRLLFPIGHLKKEEVRKIAEQQSLTNARKKDSTGICFVGSQNYSEFIAGQVAPSLLMKGKLRRYPGGEVITEHEGIHHFTYGQRKGLGIAVGEPVFVLKIDAATRDVWVGEEKYLFSKTAQIEKTQFLDEWDADEIFKVKIRFQHKGTQAKLRKSEVPGKYEIEFLEPVRAVTPGQAAVIYRDSQLLGGGWIL
jgi:tRNA-uridine 2-sulfurtransferase